MHHGASPAAARPGTAPEAGHSRQYDRRNDQLCKHVEHRDAAFRSEPLSVVRGFVFPGQFVKWRLVTARPVDLLRHVEFLSLVIFDVDTVLRAPAVAFPVNASGGHTLTESLEGRRCNRTKKPRKPRHSGCDRVRRLYASGRAAGKRSRPDFHLARKPGTANTPGGGPRGIPGLEAIVRCSRAA